MKLPPDVQRALSRFDAETTCSQQFFDAAYSCTPFAIQKISEIISKLLILWSGRWDSNPGGLDSWRTRTFVTPSSAVSFGGYPRSTSFAHKMFLRSRARVT